MLELNLNTKAATQTTQAYNSMCMLGDIPLGCTSSGLHRIGGFSDHDVAIPALIRSGKTNFGTERPKRARFFYFDLECTGDLSLSIYCDGGTVAEYAVDVGDGGVRRVRVPVSRVNSGVWWEWQIENVDGSFFALYQVQALPVIL